MGKQKQIQRYFDGYLFQVRTREYRLENYRNDGMDDMDDLSPWQQITDSILLQIFSSLDAHDLLSVSQTCKVWYRISQDETLWKGLVRLKIKQDVELPESKESWKSEYKRLVYHCPIYLSESLSGHVDQIYHVTFSPSGQYFSTAGKEGAVRLWKYGFPSEHISCNRLFTPPAYSRYSKFNQSETLLLVAGIVGAFSSQGAIGILSIENDLALLYYVTGEYPNFRGAWLDNTTFLNAGHYFDEMTYFKLDAHQVSETTKKKGNVLPEEHNGRGVQVLKTFPCNPRNDFVHIIDPQRWTTDENLNANMDVGDSDLESISVDKVVDSEDRFSNQKDMEAPEEIEETDNTKLFKTTENLSFTDFRGSDRKIALLCHSSRQLKYEACMAFYCVSSNSVEEVSKPFKTIEFKAGIIGVTLTNDHRYLVYNIRQLEDQEEQHFFGGLYNVDIQVRIYDLYQDCHVTTVYTGAKATSNTHLSYIFPDISSDFVAGGSEYKFAHVWDRHYASYLQSLSHKALGPHDSGVNAVAFHPQDQETLITVADDKIVKIWRSKNKLRTLPVQLTARHKKTKKHQEGAQSRGDNSDDSDMEELALDVVDSYLPIDLDHTDSDSDTKENANSLVKCCYRPKHRR